MKRKEKKQPGRKIMLRQVITSFLFYGVNFIILFFPWIVIGENRYNLIRLALEMKNSGLKSLLAGTDVCTYVDNVSALQTGVWMELFVYGVFFLLGVFHLLSMLRRKDGWYHAGALAVSVMGFYIHMAGYTILDICTDQDIGIAALGMILLFCAIEFAAVKIMGIWEETKQISAEYHEKEREEKEEKQRRIAFAGRYNELFYRFVWKNFKSNWRDYILLFLCSSMVFAFLIIGFGLQKLLAVNNRYVGMDQVFGGLNIILMNAVIPVGIMSVIITVILVFYYLRCRAKNYGIFLTLGMRKKTLWYFVAMEFVSLLFFTLIAGGLAGTGVLLLFSVKSQTLTGRHMEWSSAGVSPYVKSVLALCLMFLVSFMAARDIFVDFNMGRSTELKAVREKMPGRWRKVFFVLGLSFIVYSIYSYRQLYNFENVKLLAVLTVGIFLVLRCGIAQWFMKESRQDSYLKKLLIHNQIFHKSKTNTGYIFGMVMIQFFALFYFTFQAVSVEIAEEADTLYPYDIVCAAGDQDDDIFKELREKYDIRMQVYPMVRITNFDSTEKTEGMYGDIPPIQGQHIGISESTYHSLKAALDRSYSARPLHLDDKGERIYIVHQQDKSVKAQPLDFFASRKEPLLHIGQPCSIGVADAGWSRRKDVGYYFKIIEGEEIGVLTGAFRQGLRDNLVVFSDVYFEEAREFWKTRDIYTGEPIPEEEEKIEGVNIRQGPTKLVLISAGSADVSAMTEDLKEFKKRHKEEESYDASVSCLNTKPQAVLDLRTERLMKTALNLLVMIVSFLIYFVFLNVKMATEADLTAKRTEFLTCMGMRRKERKALVRNELLRYYYLFPTGAAAALALLFTAAVFLARQYTRADILHYIRAAVPVWAVSLLSVGILVVIRVTVYIRRAEEKNV
ncbi:hypothetical protein FMM74_000165 [Lachnospiraceae bacterium MD308]|nr:hypothetical protein [Lachnospiraceae bacterium MD308]